MTIVTADARNAQTSGGLAIDTFFMIWTATFMLEMAFLMRSVEALRKRAGAGNHHEYHDNCGSLKPETFTLP